MTSPSKILQCHSINPGGSPCQRSRTSWVWKMQRGLTASGG